MNYELAKQLKDAGFPQKQHYNSDTGYRDDFRSPELVAYPTLSELIGACGDKFRGLEVGDWLAEDKSVIWYAKSKLEIIVEGNTPEGAVANLWLELNKKNAQ